MWSFVVSQCVLGQFLEVLRDGGLINVVELANYRCVLSHSHVQPWSLEERSGRWHQPYNAIPRHLLIVPASLPARLPSSSLPYHQHILSSCYVLIYFILYKILENY